MDVLGFKMSPSHQGIELLIRSFLNCGLINVKRCSEAFQVGTQPYAYILEDIFAYISGIQMLLLNHFSLDFLIQWHIFL